MPKGCKLAKLKSVVKKWQSMSKLVRTNGNSIAADEDPPVSCDKISGGLHPVYVGKSRRRYLISSDVIDHPLFRVLVDSSGGSDAIAIGCEVVMFDHLLWMLQHADPLPESLDELIEFYTC
ncbi:hypothetical protein HHK36_021926 [Tetracentron sinense]|uniref:Uncharacterized protein n=1 Tax=Tetracentron sinense TaxID=13715 RepID=A0A835DB36_TETSI|nr:hypothetical protein HHK36_021926 [Tetracentron sinense]